MIVLVLLRQLKPVHFHMQVFEQVHLLLCQRLELWWTTSSVVHKVVADVATTKADADGIVWHREKPADIVTISCYQEFFVTKEMCFMQHAKGKKLVIGFFKSRCLNSSRFKS